MKTIIETTHLEFDKSAFLIDLVQHENDSLYIEIIQSIFDSNEKNSSIKINPTVLTDIIKVLQTYQTKISKSSDLKNMYISEIEQLEIQKRYLKGVSMKDLAMQFGQKPELIEMVLRNREIEIVGNFIPRPTYWRDKSNDWKRRNKRK